MREKKEKLQSIGPVSSFARIMDARKIIEHHAYYFIKFLVLILGFLLIALFSFNLLFQFMTLVFLLISYIAIGLIHHQINHDLSSKIVIEYILVSSLILTAFLFLNITRL